MNIPKALKTLRTSHDLTQRELAENLGISKSHIAELESGKKIPYLDTIKAYAVEFKVKPSEIMLLAENADNPENFDAAIDRFPHPKIQAMLELRKNFR